MAGSSRSCTWRRWPPLRVRQSRMCFIALSRIWRPAGGFAHAVAHKASPDQVAILEAVQRPLAVKCIQEKAPVPAWKTKPSWFLLAQEDRMIAPETQCYMAQRMGAKIRSHHVDHSPMYTAPDVVVGVILEAARETLAC